MARTINNFKGKEILVMGLGLHGGGVGTVEFLMKQGARVTVTDLRDRGELEPSLKTIAKYRSIRYVLGRHRKQDFRAADLIIKNPGVRRDNPFLQEAQKHQVPVTSDVNIFFQLCPARIIGVTGTRGKSTTTYLIWKFLKTKFRRVHYGGNIRRSVLSLLPRIKKDDLVVLELSSFQLQDLAENKKSPHVAVLTNLLNDHLNWHQSRAEYVKAKQAIFRFQRADGHLFIYRPDSAVRRIVKQAISRVHTVMLPKPLQRIVDQNLGVHYRPAAALAIGVGRHFDVSMSSMRGIFAGFHGLEARQEEIATVKGVHFINDTTATIPDAAIAAIARFRKLAGRHHLVLIAGGQDKKLNFRQMAMMIKRHADALVLLPGTATDRLRREVEVTKYKQARTMSEAVKMAWQMAQRGDYIVLSPGAASFGLFLNEFDRGKQFTDQVERLKTLNPYQ